MSESKLNLKFSFENFMVGDSNLVSHRVAGAVIQHPGAKYNPLFIFGGTGIGKTHLLHAMGNALHTSTSKLFYRTSEDFLNGAINASRTNKLQDFRARLQNIDVLLVDDIQLLESKPFAQKEFLHALDYLCELEKQVVLVCDRAPKDLNVIDRLRDRLQGGFVVEISSPEHSLKISILRAKALINNINLPEDVASYLASVNITVRELEGAINQLAAYELLTRQTINLEAAQKLLGKRTAKPEIAIHQVVEKVSERFGYKPTELKAKSNSQSVVYARSIAMYLVRQLSEFSLPEIGRYFNKHHTTVIHAISKIDLASRSDANLAALLMEIEETLLSQYSSTRRID